MFSRTQDGVFFLFPRETRDTQAAGKKYMLTVKYWKKWCKNRGYDKESVDARLAFLMVRKWRDSSRLPTLACTGRDLFFFFNCLDIGAKARPRA